MKNKELNVRFNIRNLLSGFLLSLFLLPAVALANTEFKGKETVNINKASAETFAAYLHGVGSSKAQAIVDFRKENGKFSKITDLNNVPGIGEATYKDIKKNVSTSRGKSVAPQGYTMPESSDTSTTRKKPKKKKPVRKADTNNSDDSGTKSTRRTGSGSASKSTRRSGTNTESRRRVADVEKAKKPKKPKKPKKAKKSKKKKKSDS